MQTQRGVIAAPKAARDYPFLQIPRYRDIKGRLVPPRPVGSGAARRTKSAPDALAFVLIPHDVALKVGLYTREGARLDLAVLSALLMHGARTTGANPHGFTREIETPRGPRTVSAGAGQWWVSLQTAADDILRRWFGSDAIDSDFAKAFYERVRTSARRLVRGGYIVAVREAVEGSRRYGTIWSLGPKLSGLDLAALPKAPMSPVLLLEGADAVLEAAKEGDYINAIDLVQSAFFRDNPRLYTQAEGRYRLHEKGREVGYLQWMRRVAQRGSSEDSMLSAGAWKRGEAPVSGGSTDAPCFFPFIVLDIDRADLWDAHADAQQVIYDLEELGARSEDLIVSFTGGRGFHVRIPAGLVGSPVFRGALEAQRVLREWARRVLTVEVDPCTFSPLQPVRMIGSYREESRMYVRAYSGADFLDTSMEQVLTGAMAHEPFHVPCPHEVLPAYALVEAMAAASDATRLRMVPSFAELAGQAGAVGTSDEAVFERACAGVAEGDVWYEGQRQVHMGRSKAMFVAACGLLRRTHGDEHAAWARLVEINRLNSPPLPERELKGRMKSAVRTLRRDGQLATR